jgi:hypothetical protein
VARHLTGVIPDALEEATEDECETKPGFLNHQALITESTPSRSAISEPINRIIITCGVSHHSKSNHTSLSTSHNSHKHPRRPSHRNQLSSGEKTRSLAENKLTDLSRNANDRGWFVEVKTRLTTKRKGECKGRGDYIYVIRG